MKKPFAALRGAVLALVALGAPVAAAPAAADWTDPVEISDAGTRNASNLQIDAGPGRVAAWTYESGVAVVLPTAVGGPAPQTYAGSYGAPTVGIGGEGVGAVAFPLTTYGIVAASKPAAAGAFGEATQIEGPPNENGMKSPILAVNELGTAQLFHGIEDQTYGFGSQFTGRVLIDPASNAWSGGEAFGTGEPFTHNSAVATAVDGSTVLLLKSDNGLNFREIIPAVIEDDGSASAGGYIDASSGNASGALTNPSGLAVARMPDASVVAAFERKAGTGGGIFVADFSKSRAAGGSGGTPAEALVSGDEDGSQPKVATDAAGDTLVAWYDPSDGAGDPNAIRARYRGAGSSTWDSIETVATGNLGALDLAVDDLGNAFLVYKDDGADAIRSRIRWHGTSGGWSAGETLSTGLSGVEDPHVAVVDDYEGFAAFTADNGVGPSARAVYSVTGDATPGSEEEGGGSSEGGGGGSAASSASSGGSVSPGAAGSETPAGTPPPVLGKSVDVEPAKGVVKIRCKGQKRFTPLAAGARIPLGCLVDTRRGTVVLTAASGRGGGTQTARFWSGLFRVGQTGGRRPYTTLALGGPLGCGGGRRNSRRHGGHRGSRRGSRHRAQSSRRRHRKGRRGGRSLWGSGKGRFRTKGRYGSASVRGTIWLVADRCDRSTLFRVRRGVVRVHDDARGRNLNLRAGHSYVARPGRRGRQRR